jgi:glycerol-3-phosphate dehydrogenase
MLHAGFTYKPGSLKAQCSVEGNAEFDRAAEELDVPFRRTGKLIVGFSGDDMERLLRFKAVGEENGVPGLEIIDRKRMNAIDPGAGGNFAMYAPPSGILNPFLYTVELAENAHANGAAYHFDHEVTSVRRDSEGHHITTVRGGFRTRWVVNSAGLHSAKISTMLGIPGYVIGGFKGEYFVLDKRAGAFAKIPIYPAPGAGGGFATHATPTIDGNVLVGPNSVWTDDLEDYAATSASMEELIADGKKMFAHMKPEYFIRNFAGVRPKRIDPTNGQVLDFVVEACDKAPWTVNLVGIESPGLTCALPIARRVVGLIAAKEKLEKNPRFNPGRKGILRFAEQDQETRRRLVENNPDYGEIICRCECVTRAEILEAVHNPLGVTSLNGIKNRTRAMMGRCQGGYCESRITGMLRAELGKTETEILLGKPGSAVFTGRLRT